MLPASIYNLGLSNSLEKLEIAILFIKLINLFIFDINSSIFSTNLRLRCTYSCCNENMTKRAYKNCHAIDRRDKHFV